MKSALIVVDMQNDFLPGGSLAVHDGFQVIPIINTLIEEFTAKGEPVVYTADHHPENHISFANQGGPWPVHCVAGSHGAELTKDLQVLGAIFAKGTEIDQDAYSGFEGQYKGQSLNTFLQENQIDRVLIVGLATDYCVAATAKDAYRYGYDVLIRRDAIRGVNVQPHDSEKILEELESLGCKIL